MATLEQVEKLKARANVTFEEARNALNACNGDLLDALIMLERKGKTDTPAGGGYYSSEPAAIVPCEQEGKKEKKRKKHYDYSYRDNEGWTRFKAFMMSVGRFVSKIIDICNRNSIEAWKDGKQVISIPVTAFVILMIFMFWWIIPAMIVSLFFKVRFRVSGEELGKDFVNNAMDEAANAASATADNIKESYNEYNRKNAEKKDQSEND